MQASTSVTDIVQPTVKKISRGRRQLYRSGAPVQLVAAVAPGSGMVKPLVQLMHELPERYWPWEQGTALTHSGRVEPAVHTATVSRQGGKGAS